MLNPNPDQQIGVLASLSPEILDKLADLVVAKLVARNDRSCFPSKTSWVRIPSPAPAKPFFLSPLFFNQSINFTHVILLVC